MSKEAMKLALDALEYIEHNYMSLPAPAEKAITALREALAEQPAQQEPVAWMTKTGSVWLCKAHETDTPLFTSPPAQRTWVRLMMREIEWCFADANDDRVVAARNIEARLKEKNT